MDRAARLFQDLVRTERTGGFTLQLMIACETDNVQRAHSQSGDDGMMYVLPFSYKGRSCYRACWGLYSSRDAAQASISRLPNAYAAAGIKPIVVPIDRLQPPG